MKAVKLMIATVMMAQIATTAHADFARPGSKNKGTSKAREITSFLDVSNYEELRSYYNFKKFDYEKKNIGDRCLTNLGDPDNNFKTNFKIEKSKVVIIKDVKRISKCFETIFKCTGYCVTSSVKSSDANQIYIFMNDSEITKLTLQNKNNKAIQTPNSNVSLEERIKLQDKALEEFRKERARAKYQAAKPSISVTSGAR